MAEACLAGGIGCTLQLDATDKPFETLFGEHPGGFVVSGSRDALADLAKTGVSVDVFGEVGGDVLTIALGDGLVTVPLEGLQAAHAALGPLFP